MGGYLPGEREAIERAIADGFPVKYLPQNNEVGWSDAPSPWQQRLIDISRRRAKAKEKREKSGRNKPCKSIA